MAQRIENLVADVKLLSSAVSHDLRTPLARIRFGIDTVQEEDDPAQRHRFEEKMSRDVDILFLCSHTSVKVKTVCARQSLGGKAWSWHWSCHRQTYIGLA